MIVRNLFIFIFLGVILSGNALGQGKLVFLNGKERTFKSAEVMGDFVVYRVENQSKSKIKRADKFNVFSIVKDDGTEEIIYSPDTSEGGDPSIAEVREYIKGEQQAAIRYKKPMNVIGGTLVGLASSSINFFGIPGPFIYTTIVGSVNPKLPPDIRDGDFTESYKVGYQRKARNLKIKHSLIGGGIGFTVGIAAFAIILSNN